MDSTQQAPDNAERAFWSWLGFWLEILVLGVLAIIGAFAASGAARPGDYTCGMALSLGGTALAFLRLKCRLDGNGSGWADFLLVGDVVRTVATTTATVTYSAADQTSDGITPGDPVDVRIYQISATVGRGYPLEDTL